MLKEIFSIKNEYITDHRGLVLTKRKVITVCGIKIKCKTRVLTQNYLNSIISKQQEIFDKLERLTKEVQGLYNFTPPPKASRGARFDGCILFGYEYCDIGPQFGMNLGDHIQTIAVKNLIEKILPDTKFRFWDRDNLTNYSGEDAFTVMQGWFSFDACHSFLPNNKLYPIYMGTHFTKEKQKEIIRFLRTNPDYFAGQTIGCRDLYTKEFFEDLNIKSYMSRCLTLTLPKREKKVGLKKVFLVDIPENFLKFMPKEILDRAVMRNQRAKNVGYQDSYYVNSNEQMMNLAYSQLEEYKNEAALIITSALHCAAPCIAMGIPVVLINQWEGDRRYEALKGIIPVYDEKDLIAGKVDFNPSEVDIEDLKSDMIKNLELTIRQAQGYSVDVEELDSLRSRIESFSI